MATSAQESELSKKHRSLDQEIEREMSRPYADELKVQKLKREKLALKDELARLGTGVKH